MYAAPIFRKFYSKSDLTLEEIKGLQVRLNKFNPLRVSSYLDSPPVITAKEAEINVELKKILTA